MFIPTGNTSGGAPFMYVPDSTSQPSRCPNCKKDEDKKVVCNHCGYEYSEGDTGMTVKDFVLGSLVIIGIAWFLFTMMDWVIGGKPLFTIIANQVKWLFSLRLW